MKINAHVNSRGTYKNMPIERLFLLFCTGQARILTHCNAMWREKRRESLDQAARSRYRRNQNSRLRHWVLFEEGQHLLRVRLNPLLGRSLLADLMQFQFAWLQDTAIAVRRHRTITPGDLAIAQATPLKQRCQ